MDYFSFNVLCFSFNVVDNIKIIKYTETVNIIKRFGRNIRIHREAANLTQEQLAEKLDISCGSLSRIESGRQFVTRTTLENLSKVLKVPISDLFLYSTHSATINENKIELLQYIEVMNDIEIEFFLNQIKVDVYKRQLLFGHLAPSHTVLRHFVFKILRTVFVVSVSIIGRFK